MERPKIEKPRLQMWHNDDEQMSELLDHIDKKVFNVKTWQFHVEKYNKGFTHEELIKNISGDDYPDKVWIEAMKVIVRYLPDHFKSMRNDLFSVFKRFTLNLQERSSYMEEFEKYADALEEENERLQKRLQKLEKESVGVDLRQELQRINERIALLEGGDQGDDQDVDDVAEVPQEDLRDSNEQQEEQDEKPITHIPSAEPPIKHDSLVDRWDRGGQ